MSSLVIEPAGSRKRYIRGVVATAWAFLLVSPASAQETRDEIDRWVPSLGLTFEVFRQKMSGETSTSKVIGAPLTDGGCLLPDGSRKKNGDGTPALCETKRILPEFLGLPTNSSDLSVEPVLGAAFEIMTPALLDGYLRPRLFAHVDISSAIGFDRNLAGSGAPGIFGAPDTPASFNNTEESTIEGQGSRVTAKAGQLVVSAGAGTAFSFDVGGRRVRIKPSFEYMRRVLQLDGRVARAVKLVESATKDSLVDFRLVAFKDSKEVVYHGVGGGLELEADAQRSGPILFSVFAGMKAYYFLGDLKENLTVINAAGESATWNWRSEAFGFRAGGGLRLRWVPE